MPAALWRRPTPRVKAPDSATDEPQGLKAPPQTATPRWLFSFVGIAKDTQPVALLESTSSLEDQVCMSLASGMLT